MSVAPITPKEAQRQHLTKVIPGEVYEAVNEILAEKYCDSDITIYQNEVISRAIEKMQIDGTCVPAEDFFQVPLARFRNTLHKCRLGSILRKTCIQRKLRGSLGI